MVDFCGSITMNFQGKSCMLLLPLLFTTLHIVYSQTTIHDCLLDIQFSSTLNSSNCEQHHWGGLINSCCGLVFDDYLYALGLQANQTGKLFLNSSEQKNCLGSMEVLKENFSVCGIEKLTSGAGGCSDYTVRDVINKLGDKLRRLDEDCMPLSINEMPNENCTACLKAWEDISARSDSPRESDSGNVSADLCRFAVLVSLTSIRLYDRESIEAVYKCLGGHSLSAGKILKLELVSVLLGYAQKFQFTFSLLNNHSILASLMNFNLSF